MNITIENSGLTAIIDSLGAQLISLKDGDGLEYIWQRDPRFWDKCSPFLFPAVGRCRGDQTIINGKIYQLPKHGFCKEMEFIEISHSPDSAVFQLHDNIVTKAMYPWSFLLTLSYTLDRGVLRIMYRVLNQDSCDIYYAIGAHPGFRCPLEEGTAFEDYSLVLEKEENTSAIEFDSVLGEYVPDRRGYVLDHCQIIPLTRELFRDNTLYFDEIKSRRVSLIHTSTGHGVEVFYPDFETVAFWTTYPAEAPFLCVEPWNGSGARTTEDDEFIHKNHIKRLAPGEFRDYRLEIRPLT